MSKKPNIIIFNPDQMRADALAHLGNGAAYTPNFDALANDGVSFSNCFCQNPVCAPSRCSFMTGLYPHTNGHRTMHYLLRPGEENLLLDMKRNGYYVWASGRGDLLAGQYTKWNKQCVDRFENRFGSFKNDVAEPRGEKGSDTYFSFYQGVIKTENADGISRNNDWAYTQRAVEQIKNRPADKPFFMFLALNDPHPPYKIEQRYLDLIKTENLPERIPSLKGDEGKPSMEYGLENALGVKDWSEERFNKLRAVYLGMVAKTDELFGSIVKALKDEGIYDETAVFVISDHGDYTGDYGITEKCQNCFPDCLTNVPLIIKPPAEFEVQTGVCGELAELLDIYATALDFAGIKSSHDNFSRSLLPVMADRSKKHRDFVFCEGGRNHGEEQATESIGKATIGISDMYDPRIDLQQSEGAEHTKAAMLRTQEYKYVKRLYEQDEFYVLANGESKNEIENAEYKEIINDLKLKMLDFFVKTADNVPKDYDQRFTSDFYIEAAKQTGVPKIAVAIFAAIMKLGHKSFDEVMEMFSGIASRFKSVNSGKKE